MKLHTIKFIFLLLSVFGGNLVLADVDSSSEQGSIYTDYYGIVNVVYEKESRMVISDLGLNYTYASGFYNASGKRISNISNELKLGTPVKFHFYQKSSGNLLKDLKIISKREFDRSEEDEGVKLE